jgi:hypothetical protein
VLRQEFRHWRRMEFHTPDETSSVTDRRRAASLPSCVADHPRGGARGWWGGLPWCAVRHPTPSGRSLPAPASVAPRLGPIESHALRRDRSPVRRLPDGAGRVVAVSGDAIRWSWSRSSALGAAPVAARSPFNHQLRGRSGRRRGLRRTPRSDGAAVCSGSRGRSASADTGRILEAVARLGVMRSWLHGAAIGPSDRDSPSRRRPGRTLLMRLLVGAGGIGLGGMGWIPRRPAGCASCGHCRDDGAWLVLRRLNWG